jgi:hypothetical protein
VCAEGKGRSRRKEGEKKRGNKEKKKERKKEIKKERKKKINFRFLNLFFSFNYFF